MQAGGTGDLGVCTKVGEGGEALHTIRLESGDRRALAARGPPCDLRPDLNQAARGRADVTDVQATSIEGPEVLIEQQGGRCNPSKHKLAPHMGTGAGVSRVLLKGSLEVPQSHGGAGAAKGA